MGEQYSDEILEETPERVTRFLAGIAGSAQVRTAMAAAGMDDAAMNEGQELLLATLSSPVPVRGKQDTVEAQAQRAAAARVDDWDEPNFACARGALTRFFPAAGEYLFAGNLQAAQGASAVQGVATFLLRLDALEQGTDPARAGTRDDDKKAVDLLAKRGITAEVRAVLSRDVKLVLGPTPALPAAPVVEPAERRGKLVALRLWFEDWSGTARAHIKKRGHLIRLGLARRRVKEAATADVTTPSTPV